VERFRWAKAFSIPIADETPDGFPPSTLACQRALTALTLSPHKSKLPSVLDAVYATFWIDRKPIQNPEIVIAALSKVVGEQNAKELFEKGSTPEIKKRLAEATEEAFQDGAFGLPWFVGEYFVPAM
jgi:2-hydroxychromene-2-carboxylate isomerase